MTLRQLVAFAIFMENNAGIIGKHPSYIFEKFKWCSSRNCPEVKFDRSNKEKFNEYARTWKLKWNTEKDYWDVPMNQFDPITGEAKEGGE